MNPKKLFYLQDVRSVVGNSMMWWARNDAGYTCDIRCARVWTEDDLNERFDLDNRSLSSKYKIHQKDVIDKIVQHHIDIQDLGSEIPHTVKHWGINEP